MSGAKAVVLRLRSLGETGQTLILPDRTETISTPGKYLVNIALMRDIPDDLNDLAIAEAVIAMGRVMDLVVIAEGVETPEQADFLLDAGCRLAQGYLYGRPVPASVLAASLQAKSARDAFDHAAVWSSATDQAAGGSNKG